LCTTQQACGAEAVLGAPDVLVAAFHETDGKIHFKQNRAVNTWHETKRLISEPLAKSTVIAGDADGSGISPCRG
jgi:hypothetical protein